MVRVTEFDNQFREVVESGTKNRREHRLAPDAATFILLVSPPLFPDPFDLLGPSREIRRLPLRK